MSLSIHKEFEGKSIFFTGVTGFVGKVLLYKLLKEFPNLKAVFVLIRTKKGQHPLNRFQKEVMSSECFAPLKKELGEKEFSRRMGLVVPVSGDMLEDKLGLSEKDYTMLVDELDYIIHMAATVNFQEILHISVRMNVLGALRVFALGKKCKHLQAMVHTSTCYVNWNRHGLTPIKEMLYPLPFEPEEVIKYILALHPKHIPQHSAALLKKYVYPNTYTFTKSMAEQLLYKYKGDFPLSIVRPSIIGCSWREPTPGWIDVITAAGAILLTSGLGILRELRCRDDNIADLVPVDFVVNTLIKTAFKTGLHYRRRRHVDPVMPALGHGAGTPVQLVSVAPVKTELQLKTGLTAPAANPPAGGRAAGGEMPFIFGACTSGSHNRLRWNMMVEPLKELWNRGSVRHPKSVGPVAVRLMSNQTHYLARFYLLRKLPLQLVKWLAAAPPPIGGKEKEKILLRYQKAVNRTELLNFHFAPFTMYQWIYENANSAYLNDDLDDASQAAFSADPYDIQWWCYSQLYSWGLTRFVMKCANKEQPPMAESGVRAFTRAKL